MGNILSQCRRRRRTDADDGDVGDRQVALTSTFLDERRLAISSALSARIEATFPDRQRRRHLTNAIETLIAGMWANMDEQNFESLNSGWDL